VHHHYHRYITDTALSAESLVNANYSNLACRPIHSRFDLASAQKEMFFLFII